MNPVEAYEQLNRRFIELAEREGQRFAPILGRSARFVQDGQPLYTEAWGDRFLSIYHESCELDPQWNGLVPAHLQVFADVQTNAPELLWRLRCAWFNLGVDLEQADREVREIAKARGIGNDVRS